MLPPRLFSPDQLTTPNTVIITTNHLGASMYHPDGVSYGDSAIDAQHLADVSGKVVIGHDRPQTGNRQPPDPADRDTTNLGPEQLAAHWLESLLPAYKESGANRVELVGRSAGSNILLEAALLEILPISGIMTIDPVAMKRMPIWRGKLRYARYQLVTERSKQPQFQNDQIPIGEIIAANIRPEDSLTRLRGLVHRQLVDIKQYQEYWASENGFLAAALIAARCRRTSALFTFAGQPLSAERVVMEPKVAALNGLRRPQPEVASLVSDFVPGTTHSSFGNPHTYAAQYLRFKKLEYHPPSPDFVVTDQLAT